jgi:small subunit ribosomal protein S1
MDDSDEQFERGWRYLARAYDEGHPVEGEVIERYVGGLVVTVEGARGLLPASQIVELRHPEPDLTLEARLDTMRGRRLSLWVLQMNRRRSRVTLSETLALEVRRDR